MKRGPWRAQMGHATETNEPSTEQALVDTGVFEPRVSHRETDVDCSLRETTTSWHSGTLDT
jgi:hypothetical protein